MHEVQLTVPEDPAYLPATHTVQSSTPTPPETVVEYLPAAHEKQVEAAASELFPETQDVHAVAPVAAAYVPAAQLEHASSPVAVV